MRRKFLDLEWFQQIVTSDKTDKSQKWCFEWNGILSIPQEWQRVSPHWRTYYSCMQHENLYQKSDTLHSVNSQPNSVNFQPNGVNCFGCSQCKFRLWHATGSPMFPKLCKYVKSAKNAKIAAHPARILTNSRNVSFGWDTIYSSDNNFFSLGWRKNFCPAGRPRYILYIHTLAFMIFMIMFYLFDDYYIIIIYILVVLRATVPDLLLA